MSKDALERQADRADSLADQTADKAVKEALRIAAREYRAKAALEAAISRQPEEGRSVRRPSAIHDS